VGAGGAGSAIAHAMVLAGVSELAIHDEDKERRESLIHRLSSLNLGLVKEGSANPSAILPSTQRPVGMREQEPLTYRHRCHHTQHVHWLRHYRASHHALIAAARSKGCNTATGADMFVQVRELMVQFLVDQ
jgi:shikimate dehydrogenase